MQTHDAYKLAEQVRLKGCNPIRMGMRLNHSIFTNEVLNCTPKAINMLKLALKEADNSKDEIEQDDRQEVVILMELIVENLNVLKNNEG